MEIKIPSTIEQNIARFTGRAWLLPVLLAWLWLRDSDARIFVLQGGPGTGKSMIAAWLAGAGPLPSDVEAAAQLRHIRSLVKAVHFCTAASGNTAPRVLAQNVAQQLAHNVPGFGDALAVTFADQVRISVEQEVGTIKGGASVTGVHIEHLDLGGLSDEASFNRTLGEPLQRLYARGYDKPLLLLVDALDEAVTYSGKTNIVSLLAKLGDLPKPVRFLLTTRPDPRVRKLLRAPFRDSSLDLIEDAPPDVADVRTYVYARLAWLGAEDRRRLGERIGQAAEGNFLYAHLVVDDLSARRPEVPDLNAIALPEALGGLYHEFLNRELGTDEDVWYEVYRPLLGLIAVAKGAGLTRAQLELLTGQDVERPLRACKQYLDGDLPDGPFRPFHKSFTDFLRDKQNVDYRIDAKAMHRQIAGHYWEVCRAGWADCDAYGLRHILSHLVGAKQWPRLEKALADLSLLEAQVVRTGIDALLLGLAEVVGQMPFEHRCRRAAKALLRVLDREAHNLRDWDHDDRPALLAQQVRNRAVYEGFDPIVASAEGRLGQLGHPYLALAWRTYRESASMQRSLVLPEFYAMTVAVLPDGRVLSGGTDRALRIWDPQTGRLLSTLPREHEGSIRDVAVTPSGRHAVTASFDGTLKVWDLEDERAVATLAGHQGAVRAVDLTPDGRHAVSAADDATLKVWDLAVALNGDPGRDAVVHVLAEHSQPVWDVAVTADGGRAVSVSDDGQLVAWDLASGERVQRLAVTGAALRSVAAVPGGSRVIVGDREGILTVVDVLSGEILSTLKGHASSVFGLAVTVDGTMALSASDDRTLRVWDLESRSLVQTLTGHGARVFDVAVSPDGRWAISAATDAMLKVWRLERDPAVPKQPWVPAGHAAAVRSLDVTPDAARAVSAAQDGTLRVWEVASGRLVHALGQADKQARHGHGVAVLPNGARALSATEDTTLRVWDLEEGALLRTLTRSPTVDEPKERNVVRCLALTPGGRRAVSAAADGRLTVWDLDSGETRRTREGHAGVVRTVAVTVDGEQALSGGEDGALKVWDLETATLVATLVVPGCDEAGFDVRALSLLGDGRVLAGHEDGLLVLWDVAAEAVVARWTGASPSVRGVAVTEDGRLAIAASIDRRVRVMDLGSGEEVAVVFLEGSPCSLVFAQDEAVLLIGDRFGSVYCLRYVEVEL